MIGPLAGLRKYLPDLAFRQVQGPAVVGARLALKNANMSPLPHGLGPVRLDWQVGLRKRPSLTQMAIMKPIRDVRQGGGVQGDTWLDQAAP